MTIWNRLFRFRWICLGVTAVVVVVLVGAQLFLPGIAAQRVRDRVDRYGTVRSVRVSALPAIELLWGKVDSVSVKAGSLKIGLPQMANLLWSARNVNDMSLRSTATDLTAASLGDNGLLLREVSLRKHGQDLNGQATLRESDLRAALPAGLDIQPVGSVGGGVQVRVSGALFGIQTSVEGLVSAREGKLIVEPTGIPLGSLVAITLFSDPRIIVEGVSAAQQSGGYELMIQARIR